MSESTYYARAANMAALLEYIPADRRAIYVQRQAEAMLIDPEPYDRIWKLVQSGVDPLEAAQSVAVELSVSG